MTIDYRTLLAKYMRHVVDQEGVTFVEPTSRLTPLEFEALQQIENEILPPTPKPTPYVTVRMPATKELLEQLAECTRKYIPLGTGIDRAVVANLQRPTRPIEDDIGADPRVLPDAHITKNQDVVVARGALAETIEAGRLPPVREQVLDRHVALVFLEHARAQLSQFLAQILDHHPRFLTHG